MAKKQKRQVSKGTQARTPAAAPQMTAAPISVGKAPVAAAPRLSRTSAAAYEFKPDYSYVLTDLKKIGTLAVAFFIVLVTVAVLSNVFHLF